MKLTTDLLSAADQFRATAPAEVTSAIENGISIVDKSLSPLAVGDVAPGFELNDATGQPVRLSDLLEGGAVVLNFYRGGWCPFCNLELAALQAALPEFAVHNASLVAISPEVPDSTLSTREKNELEFHVLSDPGSTVGREFGVAFVLDADTKSVYEGFGLDLPTMNGAGTWELVVPGTYVIDTRGIIAAAFVDADYRRRTEPAAILAVLAELAERPRPDASSGTEAEAVVDTINELIRAGTTFDTEQLERIYHADLEVLTVNAAGELATANKADFVALFDTKRRNGDAALNDWSNFVHTAVNGETAHVIVQRIVALGNQDQALTLSIDLVHLDDRWQVTREVIFASPAA